MFVGLAHRFPVGFGVVHRSDLDDGGHNGCLSRVTSVLGEPRRRASVRTGSGQSPNLPMSGRHGRNSRWPSYVECRSQPSLDDSSDHFSTAGTLNHLGSWNGPSAVAPRRGLALRSRLWNDGTLPFSKFARGRTSFMHRHVRDCLWCLSWLLVTSGRAADWPMWRCDAGRTGETAEALPDTLHLQWVRTLPAANRRSRTRDSSSIAAMSRSCWGSDCSSDPPATTACSHWIPRRAESCGDSMPTGRFGWHRWRGVNGSAAAPTTVTCTA